MISALASRMSMRSMVATTSRMAVRQTVRQPIRLAPSFIQANRAYAIVKGRSMSDRRLEGRSAPVDGDLSNMLESELLYAETAEKEEPVLAEKDVVAFQDESGFKLEYVEGQSTGVLVANRDNEVIRVQFGIAMDKTGGFPEDMEEFEGEENASEQFEDEEGEFDFENGAVVYPASITIQKGGKGGLVFYGVVDENDFAISDIQFAETAEELAAAGVAPQPLAKYAGPEWESLDEKLQELFLRYLEERGINEKMAWFIYNFAFRTEDQQYKTWLQSVRTFVDA
ncbi:mitochondrial glycoprotein [Dipodascopsis tothii]|uniref:mitochondrial glycoprotein n=1 Tax=Dipodascopsis tothii TaxID=44089 RepID=UPI0034CE4479